MKLFCVSSGRSLKRNSRRGYFNHSCITAMLAVIFFMSGIVPSMVIADDNSSDDTDFKSLLNLPVESSKDEALISGSSKYLQSITVVPHSVSIITADEIKKGGYRNFAELLAMVRSFYVSYLHDYHYVGVRGFSRPGDYNTRVLVLVDGHRINDAVYDQGPIGNDFPLNLDLIETVEVIRGAGSTMYGSSAFFAVINILTRKGQDMAGGEVSASVGSYSAYEGRVSSGGFHNNIDYLVSGLQTGSHGDRSLYYPEFDTPATNYGVAENLDGFSNREFFGKLAWKQISLFGIIKKWKKDVPTANYGVIFNDPQDRFEEKRCIAGFTFTPRLLNTDTTLRVTYNDYSYDSFYPYASSINKDETSGRWLGADLFARRSLGRHLVTLGSEQRWNMKAQQKNLDLTPYAVILDDNHSSTIQGYYLNDEYHPFPNLVLETGIRYDHHSTFGGSINPRAALVYTPLTRTALRMSYGEAFRAPNNYERYYYDGTSTKTNPALKSEKIRTFELGVEQGVSEGVVAEVTGFYSRASNLISQENDGGLLMFVNAEATQTVGLEGEIRGHWQNGLMVRLSGSYQDARNADTDEHLSNSPRWLAQSAVTIPLPAETTATFLTHYMSSRATLNNSRVGDSVLVSATLLNRNLIRGLDLTASVYNLFDKHYGDPASGDYQQTEIPQDGRTYRIKLIYRF